MRVRKLVHESQKQPADEDRLVLNRFETKASGVQYLLEAIGDELPSDMTLQNAAQIRVQTPDAEPKLGGCEDSARSTCAGFDTCGWCGQITSPFG